MQKQYTAEQVKAATLEYFHGDELAAQVWISKYCLQDKDGHHLELTPDDTIKRMTKELVRVENKHVKPLTEEQIYNSLKGFQRIVMQGGIMYGLGNPYSLTSLGNCVVIAPPEDSISAIFDTAKDMANLMKNRYGCGFDISKLRPAGAKVTNAAKTSSGCVSFVDFYSNVIRMIGMHGRRGAGIITIACNHYDVEEFIKLKQDLKTATGVNISVRVTDEFMHAVETDEDFELKFPVDSDKPKYQKVVKARHIWNALVDSATRFAEPGVLFDTTIRENTPSEIYSSMKSTSCNPCSEQVLENYGSCRLMLLNLKHYVKNAWQDDSFFDYDEFMDDCIVVTKLADDIVELDIERIDNILNKIGKDAKDSQSEVVLWQKLKQAAIETRRVGIGTTGLADALNRLNLKYDTDEAIEVADNIFSHMKNSTYAMSIQLAAERGPFAKFDSNLESLSKFNKGLDEELLVEMLQSGRRNVCLLTQSPAGSVSLLTQTSSGIEPVFKNSYIRRRKITDQEAEQCVDFIDAVGDKWQEYTIYHQNAKEYKEKFGENAYLSECFIEASDIDWHKRIEMQAVIQKHICSSISSTINLPKGTKPEQVSEIFMEAWKQKCKGITVYVDGSRTGVLVSSEANNALKQGKNESRIAYKRPKELVCDIYRPSIEGKEWVAFVGLREGKPFELFAGLSDKIQFPKKFKSGKLLKRRCEDNKNCYDLVLGEGDDELIIKDIVSVFDNPSEATSTRMISLSLRHGVPPLFIVEQLQKEAKDSSLFSFSKVIARTLKKYIKDGEKAASDKVCLNCGKDAVIYEGGCQICKSCGYSKC